MRRLALALVLLLASPAGAIDFTPTGSILEVSYDEPTTNSDGSALNDLARTEIWFRLCPTAPGSCTDPFEKAVDVPASSPAGGGHVVQNVTVAVPPGKENLVEVFALAVDTSENKSADSDHVTKRVDRLPPNRPR